MICHIMESSPNLKRFKETLFPGIVNLYPTCIVDEEKSNDQEVVLRLFFKNETVAENFKTEFSKISKTDWIIGYKNRDIFTYSYYCHLHKRNKKKDSKTNRNADCNARLFICIHKITIHTKKKYKFLRTNPPLSGMVKISLIHSHDLMSEETLRLRRTDEKVKKQFFEYFDNGMSRSKALKFHERKLKIKKDPDGKGSSLSLLDSAINPTRCQVAYLHALWTSQKNKLTPLDNSIKEKLLRNESKGAIVKVQDGSLWSVLVVTAVMKQAQALPSAGEIIFVETVNISRSSSALTILLSATAIGALPIAVLIHPAESAFKYTSAFRLLKDSCPSCFGGAGSPKMFMIDDCLPLRVALKSSYPESIQLLCQFHVIQTQWQSLFTPEMNVPHEEKPRLMKLFQAVVYAINEEELELTFQDVIKESSNYPNFVQKFLELCERKTEWISCYRLSLLGELNCMNNYIAEASIRILKFVILQRTSASSVVSLCDFCVDVWEKYLIRRLTVLTQSPQYKPCLIYEHFCPRTLFKLNVTNLGHKLFSVRKHSSHKPCVVDTDAHLCSCADATAGAFCQHLYYFVKRKHISFLSIDPLSAENKVSLAALIPDVKDSSLRSAEERLDDSDCDRKDPCIDKNGFDGIENSVNENDLMGDAIDTFDYDSMDVCNEDSFYVYSVPTEIAFPSEVELVKQELNRISNFDLSHLTKLDAKHMLEGLQKLKNIDDFKHKLCS